MYREGTPAVYFQDIITNFFIENAKHMESLAQFMDNDKSFRNTSIFPAVKLFIFYELVKNGGPLDLKRKEEWQYPYKTYHGNPATELGDKTMTKFMYFDGDLWSGEELGNLCFGYASAAYGYGLDFVTFGAGMYQILSDNAIQWEWASSFFDDPRDNFYIKKGYQMYVSGYLKK